MPNDTSNWEDVPISHDTANWEDVPSPSLNTERIQASKNAPFGNSKLLEKMGETAKQYGPAIAGSAIAAGLTGGASLPVTVGAQALAGGGAEAYRQLLAKATGQKSPETSTEAATGIAKSGIFGGASQAVLGAASTIGEALAPTATKLGAQLLRVGPAIKEKYGKVLLENLDKLGIAPTPELVKQSYDAFEKYAGIKGLNALFRESGEQLTAPKAQEILSKAYLAIKGKQQLSPQQAYEASQAGRWLRDQARLGNTEQIGNLANTNYWKHTVDDYLETLFPEYKNLRFDALLSKAVEQTKSLLPLNQNLSPNVLRPFSVGAIAANALERGNPLPLVMGPLISPKVAGLALRGAAQAKMAAPAAANLLRGVASRSGGPDSGYVMVGQDGTEITVPASSVPSYLGRRYVIKNFQSQ